MTLGEKIKHYRTEKKYSQEKIAEFIGVSRQAVTKWESNQSMPSTENLMKLTEVLDVTLEELIKSEVEHKRNEKKQSNKLPFEILIGTLLALIVVFMITKSTLIWQVLNTILLLGTIIAVITIVVLVIKTLKKQL